MKPLEASEIRGNWATLLIAWKDDESLDLRRVGAEIDALVAMKVDGIYSNGTAGEFHAQTETEFDLVSELLADKCHAAGMPFQIGISHMSAQISLERLKRVVALRPGAVQAILPDWFPVTEAESVVFLQRLAEVADGIGIVL
jgi:dihydrodipicolinate synthase/N-acetylneuraminate lyase